MYYGYINMSLGDRDPLSEKPVTAEWNGAQITIHDVPGILEDAAINSKTIIYEEVDDKPPLIDSVQVTVNHSQNFTGSFLSTV